MHILIFHPTLLPPKNYGGVERVVLWLAQGLRDLGHEVTIAALGGSQLPLGCHLLVVEKKQYSHNELVKIIPKNIDLLHFMAPLLENIWGKLPLPALLTVHGNGKQDEVFPKNSVFLSRDHAERHGANYFIYNGIDPSEYIFAPETKEDWVLFLSKTNWSVKNLSGAIRYCNQAKVPLRIAGGNRPLLKRGLSFFHPKQKWMGPVSGKSKAQLLSQARVFIFPVLWPEPFGLVVAEALMSGTPVIASRRGSLSELVPPEVGYLVDSENEWANALKQGVQSASVRWDPQRCRQWALEKFHFHRMAEEYVKTYRQILAGHSLHDTNPIGRNWRSQ